MHRPHRHLQKISTVRVFSAPRMASNAISGLRRGHLRLGSQSIPCALGRAGVVHHKREGDGGTPAGSFLILRGYFRSDRQNRPRALIPLQSINPNLGWCDDPDASHYNRPVRLPFSHNHEKLWRRDALYDFVLVLDHNLTRRKKWAGSAIFFHIAENNLAPTAGCIAVRLPDMIRILPQLATRTRMIFN